MTSNKQLQDLLEQVARGAIDPDTARAQLVDAFRARPFEGLGFARVDTHRAVRQGFPEVILGLGKTPAQISAIAERIVGRGESLLVTRAQPDAFAAVRTVVPKAEYHADARAITFSQGEIAPGKGTIIVSCAGTSDLPIAEEAAITAHMMGNTIERLYDVGVAGIHRILSEHKRLQQ